LRKLITWNLVTMDGFFEGKKKWDLDWHEYVWGDELEQFSLEQLKSIGALLFGRTTYEGMAAYWTTEKGKIADFMNTLPKIVFSTTLREVSWNNSTLVRNNAAETVASLKQQSGKDLYIFGSADLSSTFMHHGLIDEFRICLAPLVLGRGTPLFKPSQGELKLKLIKAQPLKSGCVILFYEPAQEQGKKK